MYFFWLLESLNFFLGGAGNSDFRGGGGNWVEDDYTQDFGGGGYQSFGGAGGGSGGPMRKGPGGFGARSGPYNAGKLIFSFMLRNVVMFSFGYLNKHVV